LKIAEHGVGAVAGEGEADCSFHLFAKLQGLSPAAVWRRLAAGVARVEAVFGTDLRAEEFDLRFAGPSFVSRFLGTHDYS